MRKWASAPTPILTSGEDPSAAPFDGGRASRVENGIFTGVGSVAQVPDWMVSATATNGATENNAVCGGFPFATQGGASAASAGVAFSFDAAGNAIDLHQLGEVGDILRTLTAYSGYAETAPPQITGCDMFGRAYFCADGREAVASRQGLAYFDPTGAGAVSVPTYVLGGGPAAPLRFKGIAKHRGGTLLGWGYFNETTPDVPECVRYCKYGDPTTWVPDTTPTSANFFNLGTPGLPVIAAAASGPYTVLGKASEIFVLDGDYDDQFSVRQIGTAHGPVSVTGMTTNGPICIWMSAQGPAYSVNGADVQLLAHPRVLRRMGTYLDLTYVWAAHDPANTRFVFLCRRGSTLDGTPVSDLWGTQLLCWNYQLDALSVHNTPTSCFSVFTIEGPGITLAAPAGVPGSLVATPTSTSATLAWDNSTGDPTAQTSVEYRIQGTSTFTVAGPTATNATSWSITGLTATTTYEWRLRYVKNGQFGSYTATQTFTTLAPSAVGMPSDVTGAITSTYTYGLKSYAVASLSWTAGEYAPGSTTQVFEATSNSFAAASVAASMSVRTVGTSLTKLQSTTPYYYWVRHVLSDGSVGTEVACGTNPIIYASIS